MKIKCFIDKLQAVRELPLTSDIKHIDAASANHRLASKTELYLLNYSTVIKAVKSPRCAEADISIDYPTENTKGKTVSFLSFCFRALHVRQPSEGACPTALTAGGTALCSEQGLTAHFGKNFSASKAQKF